MKTVMQGQIAREVMVCSRPYIDMISFNKVSFFIPQAKGGQLPTSMVLTMVKCKNNCKRHLLIWTFNNIEKYDLSNSTDIGSIDIIHVQK